MGATETIKQQILTPMPAIRAAQLNCLHKNQTWDILVVGGGASGLGIALEAATRGYKTLLVEQCDFAKGTSSRSTKLVHGGVRYLAQGDVKLVREASIERGRLAKNAPHLVKDQLFIVPVYNWWDRLKYTVGLKLYDKIAGKLSLGHSYFISKKETLAMLPGLRSERLKGGVVYHDGQFDDSRLAVNLSQSIWEKGGCALNYVKLSGLVKNASGKINLAELTDEETGEVFKIQTKSVINATGVFVDDVLQMDDASQPRRICVSQGVHLVLDKSFLPGQAALMIPETSDGRVLFAVPWHNKLVVGTTDTPVKDALLEPVALEKEILFILETAGAYLAKTPARSDVLSVFAGLRPLAAPAEGSQHTKEISRSHKILKSSSNLFTIVGGKWTTYRKMGEEMVDTVEKQMGWKHQPTVTEHFSIHGSAQTNANTDPLAYYGSDAGKIYALMNGDANTWISQSLGIHAAQVVWAIAHEQARTVEDFLARRTRALLLDARESRRIAPDVAKVMRFALEKDEHWEQEQVKAYDLVSASYILHENDAQKLNDSVI